MLRLDATTQAAYDAATTSALRAVAVVAGLSGTVSCQVCDGSDAVKGTGVMAAPWATASADTITVGEVVSFAVTVSGTPDANWYLQFVDGSGHYVRGTFGVAGSGKEFTWSLSSWAAGAAGSIGTATLTVLGPHAPAFTVAPTTAAITTSGTIQFTATDADGDTVTYSFYPSTPANYSINSAGLVTVAAGATTQTITVQATDPGNLYARTSCAVTVTTASPGLPWDNLPGGPSWLHGSSLGSATAWESWIGHSMDIGMLYLRMDSWARFRSATGNDPTSGFYPWMTSMPKSTPLVLSVDMLPVNAEAAGVFGHAHAYPVNGNKGYLHPEVWTYFAAGEYDNDYRAFATSLASIAAAYGRSPANFIIRLGWEMNGDWYPWTIGNNVANFKTAWARAVSCIREIIPGIWFDFSPSPDMVKGTSPRVDIEGMLPDDSTYNVISLSHHDNRLSATYPCVDPNVPNTWTRHFDPPAAGLTTANGLKQCLAAAVAHGKKFALTEWATQMAEQVPANVYFPVAPYPEWFISQTFDFLYANRANIAWDIYFSYTPDRLDNRPTTLAAQTFKALWNGQAAPPHH